MADIAGVSMLTGKQAKLSTGNHTEEPLAMVSVPAPRAIPGTAAELGGLAPALVQLLVGTVLMVMGALLVGLITGTRPLDPFGLVAASVGATAAALAMAGPDRRGDPLAAWPGPAAADMACATVLSCTIAGSLLKGAHSGPDALSWSWIGGWAAVSAAAAALSTTARHLWRRAQAQSVGLPLPIVLVGADWSAVPPDVAFVPAGDGPFPASDRRAALRLGARLPVHLRYGGRALRRDELAALLLWAERGFVTDVCLADGGDGARRDEGALLRALAPLPVAVHRVRLRRDPSSGAVVGEVTTLHPLPLGPFQQFLKRCMDIVGSALLLIVFGPLMAITAAAVRLESRGPVLFIQERRGFMNRTFPVLKFRSMYSDRLDAQGSALTRRNDRRVTAVGALIRRASIDELPQLVNVLRGEMSLVGPRPHPLGAKAGQRLYAQVADRYFYRYRMRPGLTGLAQIRGWRGTTETEDQLLRRVENDTAYVDHWSLRLDLLILLKTPFSCLTTSNAY